MLNTFRFCLILLTVVTFTNVLQAQQCSDIAATSSTQQLYKNLFQLKDSYTIFGHQDAMAYGVDGEGLQEKVIYMTLFMITRAFMVLILPILS